MKFITLDNGSFNLFHNDCLEADIIRMKNCIVVVMIHINARMLLNVWSYYITFIIYYVMKYSKILIKYNAYISQQ